MSLRKKLQNAALIIIGLVGAYLIFASGQIQVDSYSLILTLLVAAVAIYIYYMLARNRSE